LGRLIEAKGILILLDAWKILERECGSAAPKLLIGGDGPLRSVVEARVERMRSVRFAGHLAGDAKRDALARCRAMIVPSLWWEALGLVVYEAYEFSRPVLAAASGGLTEVVIPGETGLLHEPGNAAQIADHVREMEANVTDRHRLGQQGRIWLEQNAGEDEWREKFFKIASYALDATPR
jgi:glycosyltransferase involved in cell wall biosynthesis